jgi:DNA-binding Lrp family transcriptional regulator
MDMLAYVLIKVKPGSVERVLSPIKNVKSVKEVHMVTGIYDIIVLIEVPDLKTLGEIVAEKIHAIDGVSSTITCIVVK